MNPHRLSISRKKMGNLLVCSPKKIIKVLQLNVSHVAMNPHPNKLKNMNDEVATFKSISSHRVIPFENTLTIIKNAISQGVDVVFLQEIDLGNNNNWTKLLQIFGLTPEDLCSEEWCAILSSKKSGGKFGAHVLMIYRVPVFGSVVEKADFNIGWNPDGRPALVVMTESRVTLVCGHFSQPLSFKKNLSLDSECSNSDFMKAVSEHWNNQIQDSQLANYESVILETNPGKGNLITCAHGYTGVLETQGLNLNDLTEEELMSHTRYLGANSYRGGSYIVHDDKNVVKLSQRVIDCRGDLSECGSDHLPVVSELRIESPKKPTIIMGGDFNLGYSAEQAGKAKVFLNYKKFKKGSFSFLPWLFFLEFMFKIFILSNLENSVNFMVSGLVIIMTITWYCFRGSKETQDELLHLRIPVH